MDVKPKKCKGINKAREQKGCGIETMFRKYGLCRNCYKDFLLNTEQGKEIMNKSILIGSKRVSKENKQKAKEKKKEAVEAIKTKSDYEKILQKIINRIAREIDKGWNCISSNRPLKRKYDAGHYYSVGSNATLRFNLHNIFAQSVTDNQHKGGNPIEYMENLERLFGLDYSNKVRSLKADHDFLHLSKPELKEHTIKAREYLKEILRLQKEDGKFTLDQRIELRIKGNDYIGIYKC